MKTIGCMVLLLCGLIFGNAVLYEIPPQAYEWTDMLPRDGTETSAVVDGAASGVTIATDETEKSPLGGNSIKYTGKAGVSSSASITLAAPVNAGTHIGLVVKIDSLDIVGKDFFRLYEDATKYYQARPWQTQTKYGPEINKWKVYWIRRDFFTAGGTPAAWATTTSNSAYPVTKFYISTANTLAGDVNVWFGGILTYTPAKAKVMFRFDDAKDGVYDTVFPLFKARGWKGVVGVISANVGAAGYMDVDELQELYNAGWDIVNHTSAHTQGTGAVTLPTYLNQIGVCSAYLETNGMPNGNKFFIPPGNLVQLDTGTGADDIDFLFAMGWGSGFRTVYGGSIDGSNMVQEKTSCYIPNDMMNLPFFTLHSPSQTSYDFFGGVISGIGDQTDCTISEGAGSKVLITKTGQFGGVTDGWTPWMDFSATYTDGSYAVLAHDADTITIDLAYSSSTPTCTVYMRDAKSQVNKTNNQYAVGIFYTHDVDASPTTSDISTSYLNAMIADLDSRSETLEVISLSEWYNSLYLTTPVTHGGQRIFTAGANTVVLGE